MVNKQVREVTTAEFGDLVNGEWPVLADFYGTWCGPCKAMEPVIERLAKRFAGCAEVVKVNIDESRELAAAHAVRGVPTFLLFVARKAVERVVGASSEHSRSRPCSKRTWERYRQRTRRRNRHERAARMYPDSLKRGIALMQDLRNDSRSIQKDVGTLD
ncbi:MAG: thioredoxin family protein [Pyrinomonadaceae bacterium]